MPHSIIAKEIKVPLIAFGQLVQFFIFFSPFFVIKVISNINNHTCICAQARAPVIVKTRNSNKTVLKVLSYTHTHIYLHTFFIVVSNSLAIDPVKYAKS